MLYANHDGDKILASPGANGTCPSCGESLRAKCGEIVEWHWAHINDSGCTKEHEPETEWHLNWKAKFPKECVEVPIGDHRADVLTPTGIVVEFQHSSITVNQIKAREAEYDRMIWVLDARQPASDGRILIHDVGHYWKVKITSWRTVLKYFTRPVFLDTADWTGGAEMLHVCDFSQRKQTKVERFYGEEQLSWGYKGSYEDFIEGLTSETLPLWMQP